MNQFKIENANLSDLSDLRKLEEICFPIDRWPLIDLIGVLTIPGVVRKKAVMDSKFVGFIAGDVRKKQQTGWIMTIGVLPAYRGMGIAKKLLTVCENTMNMPRVLLSVRASNYSAINLYVSSGYFQKEIWRNYYLGQEDGIVFEKRR